MTRTEGHRRPTSTIATLAVALLVAVFVTACSSSGDGEATSTTAGQEPTSTEMTWPLRSVTKSYTVTLILQLVDEGKVSLDDTIDTYVTGVTDGDKITLRQLANMSSGNADYTNEKFGLAFEEEPTRIFTLAELNGFMLGEPAAFAPGAEHVYINSNTNLLGAVVEAVTGQPFGEVLEERIIEPLGLTGTEYLLDAATWSPPHPTGYLPTDGVMQPQVENLSVFGPAGSDADGDDRDVLMFQSPSTFL